MSHTKFYIPSSSGSLVIATKPKTKYRVHASAMLLFHTVRSILIKVT